MWEKEQREGGEVGGDEVREAIKRARLSRESQQTTAQGSHGLPPVLLSFIGTSLVSFVACYLWVLTNHSSRIK